MASNGSLCRRALIPLARTTIRNSEGPTRVTKPAPSPCTVIGFPACTVLGEPIWLTHERHRAAGADPALLGTCQPIWHVPARHDRPLAPRSAHPGRRSGSIPDPGHLMVRTNRYFASGDTNVGSGPAQERDGQGARRGLRRRARRDAEKYARQFERPCL